MIYTLLLQHYSVLTFTIYLPFSSEFDTFICFHVTN